MDFHIVSRALARAEDLIKAGWTQGMGARSKSGCAVPTHSVHAVTFCAYGAIRRALYELEKSTLVTWSDEEGATIQLFLRAVSINLDELILDRTTPSSQIFDWNDRKGRTQQEVQEAFSRARLIAIELLQ